ncbi:hypothetical protein RRG08_005705 [Elysia crispata]|uniref:Uncharacterized protein n=1 Tax=Elysia crispata TaxID=231223 RepID=A0AAE0YE95_9GAST|nr:hypothetical protein RRG08_005705 [Elysia crispata]
MIHAGRVGLKSGYGQVVEALEALLRCFSIRQIIPLLRIGRGSIAKGIARHIFIRQDCQVGESALKRQGSVFDMMLLKMKRVGLILTPVMSYIRRPFLPGPRDTTLMAPSRVRGSASGDRGKNRSALKQIFYLVEDDCCIMLYLCQCRLKDEMSETALSRGVSTITTSFRSAVSHSRGDYPEKYLLERSESFGRGLSQKYLQPARAHVCGPMGNISTLLRAEQRPAVVKSIGAEFYLNPAPSTGLGSTSLTP